MTYLTKKGGKSHGIITLNGSLGEDIEDTKEHGFARNCPGTGQNSSFFAWVVLW
jgi:hypothetical protein